MKAKPLISENKPLHLKDQDVNNKVSNDASDVVDTNGDKGNLVNGVINTNIQTENGSTGGDTRIHLIRVRNPWGDKNEWRGMLHLSMQRFFRHMAYYRYT